jgi:hypothetical protein
MEGRGRLTMRFFPRAVYSFERIVTPGTSCIASERLLKTEKYRRNIEES